jgi:hypothetical protein
MRPVKARIALVAATLLAGACSSDPDEPYAEFLVGVGRETFVLRATDPETVSLAFDNFRGRNAMFPIGPLRRGDGGFNAPWSWHFDPDAVRMTEVAIEVCDGVPSYVEANLQDFLSGYCPWSARVVAVAP